MFLNSNEWRQFQESVGRKTFDIGEGFVVKLDIPFGKSYLYSNYTEAPEYTDEIKKIAKKENAVFFKYEPLAERQATSDKRQALEKLGFKKAGKELQPQRTIILDLKKEEKELLQNMHKKTRYNIRLAKKRGIEVEASQDKQKDFGNFWQLMQETARRDKFNIHTKGYYKKLLELDNVKLYLAGKEGELHAAAIIIFHDNRATYLHGASNYENRRDMAPYLLHWKIIQEAKDVGMREYDLWGINEVRWPGITRFKRGFDGKEVEYTGSWDLPVSQLLYKLYVLKNSLTK